MYSLCYLNELKLVFHWNAPEKDWAELFYNRSFWGLNRSVTLRPHMKFNNAPFSVLLFSHFTLSLSLSLSFGCVNLSPLTHTLTRTHTHSRTRTHTQTPESWTYRSKQSVKQIKRSRSESRESGPTFRHRSKVSTEQTQSCRRSTTQRRATLCSCQWASNNNLGLEE